VEEKRTAEKLQGVGVIAFSLPVPSTALLAQYVVLAKRVNP